MRFINGKPWLVFGPYAGWSPKFLKHGHFTDLPRSVKPDNLVSMLGVGLTEMTLVRLSDRPAAAHRAGPASTCCANSRPAQWIRTGS